MEPSSVCLSLTRSHWAHSSMQCIFKRRQKERLLKMPLVTFLSSILNLFFIFLTSTNKDPTKITLILLLPPWLLYGLYDLNGIQIMVSSHLKWVLKDLACGCIFILFKWIFADTEWGPAVTSVGLTSGVFGIYCCPHILPSLWNKFSCWTKKCQPLNVTSSCSVKITRLQSPHTSILVASGWK